jgi:N-methylhydantoinase B
MIGIDDQISFELFRNTLLSISDEMALAIFRTAYSGVLKGGMDYSTGLVDAQGRMVAQGLTQPCHLGSVPTAMQSVLRHFGNQLRPGDVYIFNDPFDGGMHLPDIFVIKPVFAQGQHIAFAATVCHHGDVGGRVAGSNAADSTEIFQEGVRIPPLKFYDAGKLNDTLMQFLEANVRLPTQLAGDLRAQLAACHIAEEALIALAAKNGVEEVRRRMGEILDHTERLTRKAISALPEGTFEFTDWIDDDGIDTGVPIPLKVTLTKSGDGLHADWSGSAPQVRGAINSTLSFTKAAVYTAVKSILPLDIQANEGFFAAVSVTAPAGSIANAVMPAATAARGLTGFRMMDCCFGALARMLPDRVCAASDGGNVGVSVGGYSADRKPFVYVDFTCGAWGGRPWADGLEGNASLFGNISSSSVEMIEIENPLEILAYEFVTDSMGAGKYRGGAAYRRRYRFKEDSGVLQIRSDRCSISPYGLYGGSPGGRGSNTFGSGADTVQLPSKVTRDIRRGDTFQYEMAGGGGWGDPIERDPQAVLWDVRNEFVSVDAARRDYGVIIDRQAWEVDRAATAKARAEISARRKWAEVPFVQWRRARTGEPDLVATEE